MSKKKKNKLRLFKKKPDPMLVITFFACYALVLLFCFQWGHVIDTTHCSVFDAFLPALDALGKTPFNCFPVTTNSTFPVCFGTGVFLLAAYCLHLDTIKHKKDRKGEEKGSAGWYKDMDVYNEKYSDPPGSPKNDGEKNMILNSDVFLNMDTRVTLRNNNILIIGGSGSGKSRFFAKPNILQANCSFVITDPAGELLETTAGFLEKEKGYKVKVFNLVEMAHSCCYNPFEYIRDEAGVVILINCLIKNTTPPGKGGGDPFWEKSETALLQALILLLWQYRPKEEQNFSSVMKLLRAAEVDENNPNLKSPLDKIFDDIEKMEPASLAVKQYKIFKMGAGKTLKSILISTSVRLTVFNMKAIENLTNKDTIGLRELGDEKQVLYVVIPAADDTYNFIVSMMYSQLFETLYYRGETECGVLLESNNGQVRIPYESHANANEALEKCKSTTIKENEEGTFDICGADGEVLKTAGGVIKGGYSEQVAMNISKSINEGMSVKNNGKRLPTHVRFILDEFANIGQIPDFDKKLATMRKYEISCSVILQNLAQIKQMYEKSWEGLVGNCDSLLFLGSPEQSTLEYISKQLGKETITVGNRSLSGGKNSSQSQSYNQDSRELMTPDELFRMDNSECIVFIRGEKPFKGKKFDYTKHKNYKYTGDANSEFNYPFREKFNNQRINKNQMKNQVKDRSIANKKAEIELSRQKRELLRPKEITDKNIDTITGVRDIEIKIEDRKRTERLMERHVSSPPKNWGTHEAMNKISFETDEGDGDDEMMFNS